MIKRSILLIASALTAYTGFSQCLVTQFNVTMGSCNSTTTNYGMSGSIEFVNAPSTGTLIVEIDNGSTVYDTIINLPFVSPTNWSISNIPSDGLPVTVTTYFSDQSTCSSSVNLTAPADCSCVADAGVYTATVTGTSTIPALLSYGDQLDIALQSGYVAPTDENIGGITYDPGIAYLIYNCQPYVMATTPLYSGWNPADTCLQGILNYGTSLTLQNTNGAPPNYGFPYTNNTLYIVPITMYSMADGVYATSMNGGDWCYDMGDIFRVTYLPQIQAAPLANPSNGTVEVTLSGGYPELFTSDYTITSSGAGTLSASTVTGTGNTFTLSGLNHGDAWECTIQDTTGTNLVISDTFETSIGLTELNLDFSMLPNPAKDLINITLNTAKTAELQLFNQLGEIVLSERLTNAITTLDVSAIPQGIYLVKLTGDYSTSGKLLIIE